MVAARTISRARLSRAIATIRVEALAEILFDIEPAKQPAIIGRARTLARQMKQAAEQEKQIPTHVQMGPRPHL